MSLQEEKRMRVARELIRIVHECEVGMRQGVRYFRAAQNHAAAQVPASQEETDALLEATNLLKRAVRLPFRVEARMQALVGGGWTAQQLDNAIGLVSSLSWSDLTTEVTSLKAYSETLRDNKQNQGWTEIQIAEDIEANGMDIDSEEAVPVPIGYVDDF